MDPDVTFIFKINDISTDPVKFLWYFYLHPAFGSKWAIIYISINVFTFVLLIALAVKGILLSYNTDIFLTSEYLSTCMMCIHALCNVLTLYTQRHSILKLLEQKLKFWKIEKIDEQSLYLQNCKRFNLVRKIMRCYYFFAIVAGGLYDLQPFATGVLPVACYVPDGWFYYLLVMIWYVTVIAVVSIVGSATLFCSLVVSVIEQFELLAHRFRDMCNGSCDNIWEVLATLIDHKNFLLSYCEDLNAAFTSIFLMIFLFSLASASVAVFIVMQSGTWLNRMASLVHFCTAIVEMGFYCIPPEIITSAVTKINDLLYDSKWYEIEIIDFKKCLTLVMSRTQKPLVFSGHGLVNSNLNTYILFCKTIFSFYTYLNTLK